MRNFDYKAPTRLIFGKGVVAEKFEEVMSHYGKNVLLTYGGGSIKRSGLYDDVKRMLKGKMVFELPDIQPNPKFNPSVLEGASICQQHAIDVILSVGGGSVLDCSKAIAGVGGTMNTNVYDDVEGAWDIVTGKRPTSRAIPIVDIITLAATGSEFDSGGVISRTETNDKLAYFSPLVYPAVSFIDPTYTFTLPVKQTLAGVADCICHIMEQYFCGEHIDMNDAFMEGAIRSLIKNTRFVLEDPENYEARAEIFYATTLGCNGIYSLGNSPSGWPMHGIEHALSGYYDITHGEGLAIIMPVWMEYIFESTTGELHGQVKERILKFGKNIFGTRSVTSTHETLFDLFYNLGMPYCLAALGIKEKCLPEIAHHIAVNEGLERAWVPLNEEDILKILIRCY